MISSLVLTTCMSLGTYAGNASMGHEPLPINPLEQAIYQYIADHPELSADQIADDVVAGCERSAVAQGY